MHLLKVLECPETLKGSFQDLYELSLTTQNLALLDKSQNGQKKVLKASVMDSVDA